MKIKELIKKMEWKELEEYIENHPHWRLPTFNESLYIGTSYREFWTSSMSPDRHIVYNNGHKSEAHSLFKKNVVLVENEIKKEKKMTGLYLFSKNKNGKNVPTEIEFLTKEEIKDKMQGRTTEELIGWIVTMARTIKEVEEFMISEGYERKKDVEN